MATGQQHATCVDESNQRLGAFESSRFAGAEFAGLANCYLLI
jgi:hypothetical protein